MSDEEPKKVFSRTEALVKVGPDAKVITREDVEKVASVVGPGSAAADALRRADEHDGPVRFWYSEKQGMLSVELMKPTLH